MVIMQGPEEDSEEESALGVKELLALQEEKAKRKKAEEEEKQRREKEETEAREEKERARGVSWGMDDEEEEGGKFPDMEKNPFAELADNESLYIEDPKKAIERWFEREGYDFDKSNYVVTERGYAHFHCRLDLPSECQPNFAEAGFHAVSLIFASPASCDAILPPASSCLLLPPPPHRGEGW